MAAREITRQAQLIPRVAFCKVSSFSSSDGRMGPSVTNTKQLQAHPFLPHILARAAGHIATHSVKYGSNSLTGSGSGKETDLKTLISANWSTEVTQRWNLNSEPTFYGAIKPAIEADIQHIVNISAAYGVPFLATGGGHGLSTTLGRFHDGLEIDLSNFDSVDLDAGNNELTVGGATVFSDLYETLYNAGKLLRTCAFLSPPLATRLPRAFPAVLSSGTRHLLEFWSTDLS